MEMEKDVKRIAIKKWVALLRLKEYEHGFKNEVDTLTLLQISLS